jgi:hypothetical protein
LKHAPLPDPTGGYQKVTAVKATVVQAPTSATSPLVVSFKTTEALPKNEEYQVAASMISTTVGSCQDESVSRVYQPADGQTETVTVTPSSTATTPGNWCPGFTYIAVSEVPKGFPQVMGTILGYSGALMP